MNLLSLAAMILLYFAAGFLSDFLVASYLLAFLKRKRGRASLLTFTIDIFGYAVTATLVLTKNIPGAVSFALGTALGTWVAMGKKKEDADVSSPR